MTDDGGHFFMCLLVIYICYLVKYLFKSLPIFNFSGLIIELYFYIFYKRVLSQIYNLQIFFPNPRLACLNSDSTDTTLSIF